MDNTPASKETIKRLYENMDNNYKVYVPMICGFVNSIENIEKVNIAEVKNEAEVSKLKLRETLFRLSVFAMIVNLDLSTFLRANFRTESNPERRCNLKYINVFTLEGYRYLFGSKHNKKNSIWLKFKLLADQTNDIELKSDICDFEQYAKGFGNQYNLDKDIDSRNLSVHYDEKPLNVYKNLEELSEEEEAKRTIAFLKVLERLSVFVKKHVQKYRVTGVILTNNYDLSLQEAINFLPDKDNKLFNTLADTITSYSTCLDSIVSSCRQPESIKEKLNLDDSSLEQTQALIESMCPVIHMHFIYLDLASAIRAYLSSEHYFEKQMNIRRINIVVYEGFKHIFGYSDKDQQRSFWQKSILSVLENSTDQNLKDSIARIEVELKELATNTDINNERLRECSVHYRYQDRDNILPLFHVLIDSNPLVEMNKALTLIKILPKLIELNIAAMSAVNEIENEKRGSSNKEIIGNLDSMLVIIEKSTITSEQKQKQTEILNKFKSRLT